MLRVPLTRLFPLVLFLWFSTLVSAQRPSIQQVANQVNLDSLMVSVNQLSGAQQVIVAGNPITITSRYWNDAGNAHAQSYIISRLASYQWQFFTQAFGTKGLNIVARKQGVIWPNRKVIIGAHFDSMPNNISPGADDNASGVAVVLELARLISINQFSFPVTVELVFWDEEEVGLLGSKAHVASLSPQDTILAVFNLDMLAWDSDADGKTNIHAGAAGGSTILAGLALDALVYANGLQADLLLNSQYPSDHKPFIDFGYPAIGLTEDYQFDINAAWHTTADVSTGFNEPYFLECAKWAAALFFEVAWYQLPITNGDAKISMNIAPNPSATDATLYLQSNIAIPDLAISIYDFNGKLAFTQVYNELPQGFTIVHLPNTLNGLMYIVSAEAPSLSKKDTPSLKWVRNY